MHRVIIIEDEFFAANHLRKLINSIGFDVVNIYYSGEEFLKETDWEFDIAIVDIFLADTLTGLDVAKYLNEKVKPFIFLTANQDTDTVKKAAFLSPSAYISKPFKPNDVSAALEILFMRIRQKEVSTYDVFFKENRLSSESLTISEVKVLQNMVKNATNIEIADKLFVSQNTVKFHIRNILRKFSSNSKIEVLEKVRIFLNLD